MRAAAQLSTLLSPRPASLSHLSCCQPELCPDLPALSANARLSAQLSCYFPELCPEREEEEKLAPHGQS